MRHLRTLLLGNQRDASIEDQVRQCRARIKQEDWQVAEVYSDHAISGCHYASARLPEDA
jgi:hypothetical protein